MSLPRVAFGSRQLKKQRPLIKGTDVRRLQQALKHLGFFRARVDGVFGYRTSEAVREFQSFFKLKQNGKVSDDEFNILTELVQAGINKWHTPCHDFAHTGYLPAPITAQLTLRQDLEYFRCSLAKLHLRQVDCDNKRAGPRHKLNIGESALEDC